MSGYFGFSKSNNAVNAENNGRFPATTLATRLGVKPGAIREIVPTSEWHHTSKHFNTTPYYSEEKAMEYIEELRAWREPKNSEEVLEGCTGSYLVWSGTRNFPKATKVEFGPCRVTKKGTWFTLHISDTQKVRKGEATRGFHLRDAAGKLLTHNID